MRLVRAANCRRLRRAISAVSAAFWVSRTWMARVQGLDAGVTGRLAAQIGGRWSAAPGRARRTRRRVHRTMRSQCRIALGLHRQQRRTQRRRVVDGGGSASIHAVSMPLLQRLGTCHRRDRQPMAVHARAQSGKLPPGGRSTAA